MSPLPSLLVEQGLEAPPQRRVEGDALADLDPLELQSVPTIHAPTKLFSFVHFLNLLWQPLIRYINSTAEGREPAWSETLSKHQQSLIAEMEGIVPSASEILDFAEWIELIRQTLKEHLDVDVPTDVAIKVLSTVAPQTLETTPANAMHIMRSSLCCKLVGSGMAQQVSRKILARVAEQPVPLLSDQRLLDWTKKDLIASLAHQQCPQGEDEEGASPPVKKRRSSSSIDESIRNQTLQAWYALENKVTLDRCQDTVASVAKLASAITQRCRPSDRDEQDLNDALVSRQTLGKHLLILDGAMDRWASDKWFHLRQEGLLAGCALATDESPPKQPRFRGLRFQITVMYVGAFKPPAQWETSEDPPILKNLCLCDIMHCPGKKGIDVSNIITKQLARHGLNCLDVVSCTGDGGGENEGRAGIHAHFEGLHSGYVRRRCLPHLSWRTADAAIRASALDYKALAAYMVEGITWKRLQDIAVAPLRSGGLALFAEGSRRYQDLFNTKPSAIIENRPETDLAFLKFLKCQEHALHQLATKDLEQRELKEETRAAVLSLGNIAHRIRRTILAEVLDRCMFLKYWSDKHACVASNTTWDALVLRCTRIIADLDITETILTTFNTTQDELHAMDPRPTTWVSLAVHDIVGEEGHGDHIAEALEFHRQISGHAAAHLNLTSDNTFRTPWMAAKLLSKDKDLARDAAKALLAHIASTRPENRTSFEVYLLEEDTLWKDIEEFSNAEPPVLLWQNNLKYEALFKFLAPSVPLGT